MDKEDYERAWAVGYDNAHTLMVLLRVKAKSGSELRQMAEGVSDLLQMAADDLERNEKVAS